MKYRTDDSTRWGLGKGANLLPGEVDLNFWEIISRVVAVETNPAKPAEISNIQVVASQMTIFLSDGRTLGPYTLPTAMIRYRGDWTAGASYQELDLVLVPNNGVYLVLRPHVAGTTFSATAADAQGQPLYRYLFPSRTDGVGADAPSNGILYGRLNAAWTEVPAAPTWTTLAGKPATFPADPHSHDWASITAKPATFPPDAHSHDWASITLKPATFPPSGHNHPWGEVTGKPATIDAIPPTLGAAGQVIKVNSTGTGLLWVADDNSGTGTGGATNLDGLSDVVITAPATGQILKFDGTQWVNGTDSTGSGAGATNLDGLSDVAILTPVVGQVLRHNGTEWVNAILGWADVSGKPATFTPSGHTHPWADVTGRPATIDAIPAVLGAAGQILKVNATANGIVWSADDSGAAASNLDALTDVAIVTPAVAQTLRFDGTGWVNAVLGWADIGGKPATFPPSAHTHLWADLTDKPATFPPSAHTHAWVDVTGKPATVAALPAAVGTEGQVLKAGASGTVVWGADSTGSAGGSTTPTEGSSVGAHKYWRMDVHDAYGAAVSGNDVSVFTLEFRNAGVENVRTGGVAFGGMANPSSAFDGSNTSNATGVYATHGRPMTIGYQFANPVTVDAIQIGTYYPSVWGPATPAHFDISFSDDGVTYTKLTTIDDRGNAVLEYKVFTIPTVWGQRAFSAKVASYQLANDDLDPKRIVEMNVATANTVTIPAGLTKKGDATIIQLGAGITSLVAGVGVTLRSPAGLRIKAQFGQVRVTPRGGDIYYLTGDLVV